MDSFECCYYKCLKGNYKNTCNSDYLSLYTVEDKCNDFCLNGGIKDSKTCNKENCTLEDCREYYCLNTTF